MQSKPLTERERAVLEYIGGNIKLNGFSPSVRDIQSALGIKSTSTVQRTVDSLEKKGYIQRESGKSRSVRVDSYSLGGNPAYTVRVPVLREIGIGSSLLAADNYEGYIDFPLMGRVYGMNTLFAFRMKNESMLSCGILPGDTVVISKSDKADAGDIVMELSSEGAALKKLSPETAGQDMMKNDDSIILGRVISVMRFYRKF